MMTTSSDQEQNLCFWELKFSGRSHFKSAKVAEINHGIDTTEVFSLLRKKWDLSEKNLAFVLCGETSTQIVSQLHQKFCQSIVNLAAKTGALLITDGSEGSLGLTDLELPAQIKVVSIGIKRWNSEAQLCQLIPFDENAKNAESKVFLTRKSDGSKLFDKNHSHFILLNENDNLPTSSAQQCILNDNVLFPVFILFNGSCTAIQDVSRALESNIPVVIMEGSGGVADFLATLCEYKTLSEKNIKSAISGEFHDIAISDEGCLLNCIRLCHEKRSLIKVHRVDLEIPECQSFNIAIISSILNEHVQRKRFKNVKTALKKLLINALVKDDLKAVELYIYSGVTLDEDDILGLYRSELDEKNVCHALLKKQAKKKYQDLKKTLLPPLISWDYDIEQGNSGQIDMNFELFLWCIVMNRSEMSQVFFSLLSGKLSASIGAMEMLKSMIVLETRKGKKDSMKCHAREYKSLALGILDECFADSASKTGDLLIRRRDEWGGLTLLQISIDEEDVLNDGDNEHKDIVSQKAVRYLLNKVWYGIDQVNGKNATFYTLSFYGVCLFLIAFLPLVCCGILGIILCADDDNDEEDDGGSSGVDKASTSQQGKENGHENKMYSSNLSTDASSNENKQRHIKKRTTSTRSITTSFATLSQVTVRVDSEKNETDPSNMPTSPHPITPKQETADEEKQDYLDIAWKVMHSPFAKFQFNAAVTLGILWLYAYSLLFDYRDTISVIDFILIAWCGSLFVEEIHELYHQRKRGSVSKKMKVSKSKLSNAWLLICHYWSDYWNFLDIASIAIYFVSFGLKMSYLDISRILATVAFILHCVRTMQIFTINKNIGPKLIMIREMILDFLYFCFIMLAFFVAYGIAIQSILYPNQADTWFAIKGFLSKPFWHLYGELLLSEIDYNPTTNEYVCTNDTDLISAGHRPCPQQQLVAPFFTAAYLLLTNILLLNLLIAILNNTYATIEKKVDRIWNYQRFELIEEYEIIRSPLPPPLSILGYLYKLLRQCCVEDDNVFRRKFKDKYLETLKKFEENKAIEYMQKIKKMKENSVEEKINVLYNRCSYFSASISALHASLSSPHPT
ncbi:unnamed protein product [Clavelina lepadiformis]|uniref:Uncharacterized protein n=1 Tax=Clavelina lepadiformis TaxID=159417 RepID=A0ABP0F895_CLALP